MQHAASLYASAYQRATLLRQLSPAAVWDLIVIGGGATGLGVALDGLSRGYRTLLLEKHDFAKGTSSRATKLVHGGVRYLAQGDIGLVREALHERGLLLQNAPHLVNNQSFIIPNYEWWGGAYYTLGLKAYDLLAGHRSLGPSTHIGRAETLRRLGNLRPAGLRGGVVYHDGQFDDARLAVNLAQTGIELGGCLLNHFAVTGFLQDQHGHIAGVQATDQETGQTHELRGKAVVNATGVFVDEILRLAAPGSPPLLRPSQGVHLVVDKSFLPGSDALMIPKTEDGRVLFAVPWHGRVLLGTTDTPVPASSEEPQALDEEIDFILRTAGRYLTRAPQRADVRSVFAGLRPLAAPAAGGGPTKELSRSHKILVSATGLLTITGGKWTTYRRMGEDAVAQLIELGKLPAAASQTARLRIHGAHTATQYRAHPHYEEHHYVYGSDLPDLQQLLDTEPGAANRIDPQLPFRWAEVLWAARYEMARTVEDVLARRVRVLFLDAVAAVRMAPQVAALLAQELGQDAAWQAQQVADFGRVAQHYRLQ